MYIVRQVVCILNTLPLLLPIPMLLLTFLPVAGRADLRIIPLGMAPERGFVFL